jgi:hypothetical protein
MVNFVYLNWAGLFCTMKILFLILMLPALSFGGVKMAVNTSGVFLYDGYYPYPANTNFEDAASGVAINELGINVPLENAYIDDVVIDPKDPALTNVTISEEGLITVGERDTTNTFTFIVTNGSWEETVNVTIYGDIYFYSNKWQLG